MTTFANALALRFGHFGHVHGGGRSDILLLVGVVFAGALIWAISRPSRNTASN
jgi:hypothetical protein